MEDRKPQSIRERLREHLVKEAMPVADERTWAKLIYNPKIPDKFFAYIYEQVTVGYISSLDALKEIEQVAQQANYDSTETLHADRLM